MEAHTIMQGVHAQRPDNADTITGLAAAKINMGQFDEGISMLRDQALQIDPDNGPAKCFLGLGLKLSGKVEEGNEVLREVVETGNESNAECAATFLEIDLGSGS
ncbi:MAG: tetratricopeptide repeat protein [Candidatus Competibacterales bacterium]